jgi:hypothetical protein
MNPLLKQLDDIYADVAAKDNGKTVCEHGNYNGENSQGCCECGYHWYREETKREVRGFWIFTSYELKYTGKYFCIRCGKQQSQREK